MSSSSPFIKENHHGAVQELRLDRPPVNAFDGALIQQLTERLRAANQEGKRAIVLSGAPGIFTGGFDIKALQTMDRDAVKRFVRSYIELQYVIAASPIPIVAAVTGHCAAGGTSLAILCDYRFMASGEFGIGTNEVKFGLSPGKIMYDVLRRLIGARQAERLLTSAVMLSPAQALTAGLIDEVVVAERVVLAAQDYAARLAILPLQAFKGTRHIARADLIRLFEGAARQDATEEMVTAMQSVEAQAAIRAFRSKSQ